MNLLYVFGEGGWCTSVTTVRDANEAALYIDAMQASSYLVSDLVVPIEKARLVGGLLVAEDRQRTLENQWKWVRGERSGRLLSSDWTDTASAPGRLGETLYAQWQAYRQALRDVTNQADPYNIIWPVPPTT